MSVESLRSRIPPEIVQACENEMSKIPRWKGGLVESRREESDLEHVNELHSLSEEIREFYPSLSQFFDWTEIGNMIDVHDVGELISKDLVISRPDYLEVKARHKRKERLGFVTLASRYIKDDNLRQDTLDTYARYTDLDPNDPEALFTHLLDKIQAIRFGLKNVYNDKILPFDLSLQQAIMSVGLIFEFANPLLAITKGEVRNQLSVFVQVEIGKYRINGFPVLAAEARERLFKLK